MNTSLNITSSLSSLQESNNIRTVSKSKPEPSSDTSTTSNSTVSISKEAQSLFDQDKTSSRVSETKPVEALNLKTQQQLNLYNTNQKNANILA